MNAGSPWMSCVDSTWLLFVLWIAELCSMQTSHVQLSVRKTLSSSVSDQLQFQLAHLRPTTGWALPVEFVYASWYKWITSSFRNLKSHVSSGSQ